MNEEDMLSHCKDKGLEDGAICAPFSPVFIWTMFPDMDEAYTSAYFYALAYEGNRYV